MLGKSGFTIASTSIISETPISGTSSGTIFATIHAKEWSLDMASPAASGMWSSIPVTTGLFGKPSLPGAALAFERTGRQAPAANMQPAQIPGMTQPTYALVTGASRGLGKVCAESLAARKRNVVLVARSKEKLEVLATELRTSQGILAESLEFDLASPMAGQRVAQQLSDRKLRINLLVNNAGFGARGRFWEFSLERQLEMMRLNNEAIVELTFHLLPPMIEHRQGSIINVSSAAGFQPIPYGILYAATKSFVTSFSLVLDQELRPYGVTVVTVCPGPIP